MAIWQYTFRVLPRESLEVIHDGRFFRYDNKEFDEESFWKKRPLKKGIFNAVKLFLIKTKSWSDNIDLYGIEESNCFEIFFDEEGFVLSVSFRIDFTSNYEALLSQILDFCVFNGLIILDEGLNVIPLNCEQVKNVIENSPQVEKYNELIKKSKNRG
ncbi:hypothetical protein [Parapedobacter sp. DT-150]|uniref:hypothetical protein n=1 Tax=Parapedobacter sp. DT-150 TaxID=3396162 RepID=UPI003F1AAA1A